MKYYSLVILFLILFFDSSARAEKIGLALSGGGARGFAHIGVLKALEEAHIQPDLIVGCSMGAVLGGLYAAGYSAEELEHIALSTDWSKLFLDRTSRRNLFLAQKETNARHILSLRFRDWAPDFPLAISNGQMISDLLTDYVRRAPYQPYPSFDDLKIPFRAVATDIASGQPVIFSRGDLAEALRASISLPLILTPYRMDTLLLVDGGVIENIPVELTKDQGAEYVVAVDVASVLPAEAGTLAPWELADRVTTIMHIERNQKSRNAANVLITPDIGNHKSTDFTNVRALIDSGYTAARKIIPQLLKHIAQERQDSLDHKSVTFTSRAVYDEFISNLPPHRSQPTSYLFDGVRLVPDSVVRELPKGADGLGKLALLRRTYTDNGYPLAHATKLELSSGSVLYSKWEEGTIRSIRVSGLRRYRPWVVLNEFPMDTGKVFDMRWAKRGVAQIYGNDMFDYVFLSVANTDSGADLTIRVQERSSPQLRVGVSYSSERKGRGFLELLNDNVGNLGARLTLFGKYGEMDEEVRGRLTFDRVPLSTFADKLFASYLTTDFTVYWNREENDFYNEYHNPVAFYFYERTGGDLWVGRSFRRWGQIMWGIRHESIRGGGVPDEPLTYNTLLGVRTLVDTKDSYPFPTSGVLFKGQYDYAVRTWSDDRSFNRVTALGDVHLPIAKRVVLHGRAEYGWNDRILPVWGRFSLGGRQSLLGLHQNEIYGNSRVSAMGELRWDLLSRWLADAYLSALYTFGAASAKSDPFPQAKDYLHGVGAAFSLNTLLGPMSLTVGELLKSDLGDSHLQIYLNLGHEF